METLPPLSSDFDLQIFSLETLMLSDVCLSVKNCYILDSRLLKETQGLLIGGLRQRTSEHQTITFQRPNRFKLHS